MAELIIYVKEHEFFKEGKKKLFTTAKAYNFDKATAKLTACFNVKFTSKVTNAPKAVGWYLVSVNPDFISVDDRVVEFTKSDGSTGYNLPILWIRAVESIKEHTELTSALRSARDAKVQKALEMLEG